jgi:hypothetical protein
VEAHHVEAERSPASGTLTRKGPDGLVTREHADIGGGGRCDEQGQGDDEEKRARKSHCGREAFFAE